MNNTKIKAIIFDMDGVLVDSEREYLRLIERFLHESGASVKQEECLFLAGGTRMDEINFMAQKLHLSIDETIAKKEAFYHQYPIDYRAIRKEYVVEILEFLKERDVKIALASSSPMDNIKEVLKACEISSYFMQCVSGEMFVHSKPDPEIYEYSVERLGLKKSEILVVEDSTYGIQAASRAGLKVIAVSDPLFHFDTHLADGIIHSLDELIPYII